MTVKKLGIAKECSSYQELKDNHVVSQGWPKDGDVSCMFHNEENYDKYICFIKQYGKEQRCTNAFKNILREIKSGDIILAFEGNECMGIAEIPEDFIYYYDTEVKNYSNCLFPVNWIDWKDFCKEETLQVGQGGQGVKGIENCFLDEINDYIKSNWTQFKINSNYEVQPSGCQNKLAQLKADFPQRQAESLKKFQQMAAAEEISSQQNAMIAENVKLLQSNRNLVLTGAPGTGKTYLAKEIAKEIIKKSAENPYNIINAKVNEYVAKLATDIDLQAWRQRIIDLRNNFIQLFPQNELHKLTLDKYCIGFGTNDSFCWWMERGLAILGKFFPQGSGTYKIYRSKKNNQYVFSDFAEALKAQGKSDEVVMQEVANELQKCVDNKQVGQFTNSFIRKILSIYYPDEFFPINSEGHLSNVTKLFGLSQTEDKDKVLFKLYHDICEGKEISVYEFTRLLYANFNIADGEILNNNNECDLTGEYEFVQFHPSYDYTDFVEGLRPTKDEQGNVGFELQDGIFKQFCIKALNNPNKNYVFIMDEINRGEISKIFGELFFSIDPGYRGKSGKVRTQYANMQQQANDFDEALGNTDEFGYFFVPDNLYIIGTMNDIDRSVESMDFAFRRRFAFKEIKAEDTTGMLVQLGVDVMEKAKAVMEKLNEAIGKIEGLSPSYYIGASYFLKLKEYDNDFESLWKYHIEGLLREYLRGMVGTQGKLDELKNAYKNGSAPAQ